MDDLTGVDQSLALHVLMFQDLTRCTLCGRSIPPKPPYCPGCHRPAAAWEGLTSLSTPRPRQRAARRADRAIPPPVDDPPVDAYSLSSPRKIDRKGFRRESGEPSERAPGRGARQRGIGSTWIGGGVLAPPVDGAEGGSMRRGGPLFGTTETTGGSSHWLPFMKRLPSFIHHQSISRL